VEAGEHFVHPSDFDFEDREGSASGDATALSSSIGKKAGAGSAGSGGVREVNLNPERVGCGWKLLRYTRTTGAHAQEGALQLGQALRLFSPEAGGFLVASANANKGDKQGEDGHRPYLK
jgi:hypothetical protein